MISTSIWNEKISFCEARTEDLRKDNWFPFWASVKKNRNDDVVKSPKYIIIPTTYSFLTKYG